MLLNMLLSRVCNYDCAFCIEKTKEDTRDDSSLDTFLRKANHLIDSSLVDEVLLLGGEPLYYRGIAELIRGLHVKPIITTNGYRLLDESFTRQIDLGRIKAMNISLPHHDHSKRQEVIRTPCLSDEELEKVVLNAGMPVRMNVVLMRDYIGTAGEIDMMIEFARALGITSIKFGELTGVDGSTHDFIDPEVLRFNQSQYCPIPIQEMREVCHEKGGTHFYKNIRGIDVFFNSAPDFALAGGRDKRGRYYHAVLFNDGKLGFSWRRQDGLYEDENEFLRAAYANLTQRKDQSVLVH